MGERFHINILTVDRAAKGRRNYLAGTLASMERSGLWEKQKVENGKQKSGDGLPTWSVAVHVWDSGSVDIGFVREAIGEKQTLKAERGGTVMVGERGIVAHFPDQPLTQNQNLCRALREGAASGADYVILCEDDIEVCRDWLGEIARWLERYFVRSGCRLASFYTPYDEVQWEWDEAKRRGEPRRAWAYPVPKFYGACCFAVRSETARGMAETVERVARSPIEADLWLKEHFGGGEHFLASVPSFAQHVGDESYIQSAGMPVRRCPAFLGKS